MLSIHAFKLLIPESMYSVLTCYVIKTVTTCILFSAVRRMKPNSELDSEDEAVPIKRKAVYGMYVTVYILQNALIRCVVSLFRCFFLIHYQVVNIISWV